MSLKKMAVFGIALELDEAERFVVALVAAGFPARDISVLIPDDAEDPEARLRTLASSVLGLLVDARAFEVAGIGPTVGAGPILSHIASATSVSAGFLGLGFDETNATEYELALACGNVLVGVQTDARSELDLATLVLVRARFGDEVYEQWREPSQLH